MAVEQLYFEKRARKPFLLVLSDLTLWPRPFRVPTMTAPAAGAVPPSSAD